MLLESSDDIFAGHLQEWLKPSDMGARLEDSSSSRSSAADGAGVLQEYLETILTLYLYFLVILIEFFIVIDGFVVLKYTLYYINLCCSLSLKVKRAFCRGTYAQFFFMVFSGFLQVIVN